MPSMRTRSSFAKPCAVGGGDRDGLVTGAWTVDRGDRFGGGAGVGARLADVAVYAPAQLVGVVARGARDARPGQYR